MSDDVQTTVTRNDEKGRYEIRLGDTVAGFTLFRADEHGRLVFPHTEIDPAFSGRGLASRLVGQALEDVASRGETVVPVCPFVVKYLKEKDVDGLEVHWRHRTEASPRTDSSAAEAGD